MAGSRMQLIVKDNLQGWFFAFFLRRFAECVQDKASLITGDGIQVDFLDKFNLQDTDKYSEDADIFIVSGFPFFSSQEASVDEALALKDNPFTMFYHVASFGDKYKDLSYVDEQISPVGQLQPILEQLIEYLNVDPKVLEVFLEDNNNLITKVDKYNRYELVDTVVAGELTTLELVDLGEVFNKHLHEAIGYGWSETAIHAYYEGLVLALSDNRKEYISRAISKVKAHVLNGTVICFLYAENYVNEIAHMLIEFYKSHGYTKVAVYVGKHTKSNDMFHIRSEGVDASMLAGVNGGKGKPTTATVFLGNTGEATYNVLIQSLANVL